MVNNSTIINKTSNHLSPQSIEHKKDPQHMAIEIQVLAWDRHKKSVRVKSVNGIPAFPFNPLV